MGVTEAQHQSQLVWIVQIWPIFASQRFDSAGTRASLNFGLLVSCYSLLQHSRPACLELFVDHTHTHSMNNQRWQPNWLPRLTSLPRKSRDWWREPDTPVSASLQKTNRLKTNINTVVVFFFLFSFFLFLVYFVVVVVVCLFVFFTTDSFVNHFDGHFAYLKTLNFSFKLASNCVMN